jgi:hypothetical protein
MKEERISILVRRVGQEPAVETITNHLTAMQEIVGGNIEMPFNPDLPDLQIVCNEDGKFLADVKPNVHWGDLDVIFGDIFFVGTNKYGESVSITPEQIKQAKKFIAENDATDYMGDPRELAGALVSVGAYNDRGELYNDLYDDKQPGDGSEM